MGEGDNERCFLKHLRSLFAHKNTQITIRSAGGKNPDYIVDKAIKAAAFGGFDKKVIVLDSDKALSISKKKKADSLDFEIIPSTPCLEAFFLQLLEANTAWVDKSSTACKKYFQKKYLSHTANFNETACLKLFSQGMLNRTKEKNKTLERLISICSGKF